MRRVRVFSRLAVGEIYSYLIDSAAHVHYIYIIYLQMYTLGSLKKMRVGISPTEMYHTVATDVLRIRDPKRTRCERP